MTSASAPAWDPAFLRRSPVFEPIAAAASQLDLSHWPSMDELNRVFADARLTNARGYALQLVSQPASCGDYEACVWQDGVVCHRKRNWHDFFNALVWLTFPRAKAALNARHAEQCPGGSGAARGASSDALTQFDEDGMVVISHRTDLLDLLRSFRWEELFWTHRELAVCTMRFFVFGHAQYGKALSPYIGMTAKGVLLECEPHFYDQPLTAQIRWVDQRLSARLCDRCELRSPRELAPVPTLGIPGWFADNNDQCFYRNTQYFRSGRRRQAA